MNIQQNQTVPTSTDDNLRQSQFAPGQDEIQNGNLHQFSDKLPSDNSLSGLHIALCGQAGNDPSGPVFLKDFELRLCRRILTLSRDLEKYERGRPNQIYPPRLVEELNCLAGRLASKLLAHPSVNAHCLPKNIR